MFFEPENYNDLAVKIDEAYNNKIKMTELGENGFNFVKEYFSRDKIANEFWTFLVENI